MSDTENPQVVALFSGEAYNGPERKVDFIPEEHRADIVDLLEEYAARARRGEIMSITVITELVTPDGIDYFNSTVASPSANMFAMLGALKVAETQLTRDLMDSIGELDE